jgi:hypothetical protein
MLPLSFVANTSFPYDEKLSAARCFLEMKGIRDPRPVRKSLPHSHVYEAWRAKSGPRLRLVGRPTQH